MQRPRDDDNDNDPEPFPFDDLTVELQLKILFEGNTSVKDMIARCSADRRLRAICNGEQVWKRLYLQKFVSPARLGPTLRAVTWKELLETPQAHKWDVHAAELQELSPDDGYNAYAQLIGEAIMISIQKHAVQCLYYQGDVRIRGGHVWLSQRNHNDYLLYAGSGPSPIALAPALSAALLELGELYGVYEDIDQGGGDVAFGERFYRMNEVQFIASAVYLLMHDWQWSQGTQRTREWFNRTFLQQPITTSTSGCALCGDPLVTLQCMHCEQRYCGTQCLGGDE